MTRCGRSGDAGNPAPDARIDRPGPRRYSGSAHLLEVLRRLLAGNDGRPGGSVAGERE